MSKVNLVDAEECCAPQNQLDAAQASEQALILPECKIKILVAEDNDVNRRVIAGMLAGRDFDIHFVFDGIQAVNAYRELRPDIVLMDLAMPNMDGLDATTEIRKLESGSRHAKVIGLTAYATAEDRQVCLDSGMDEFLPKPVCYENLMALLRI